MKKSEFRRILAEHRMAVKKRETALKGFKRSLDYYRGRQWSDDALVSYNEPVVDNMVYKSLSTILPSVFIRNPHVYVSPRKKPYQEGGKVFDTLEASAAVELLLNYYIGRLDLKRELRRAALDASLGGMGFLQCGYDVQTETVEDGGDDEESTGRQEEAPNELINGDSPWFMRRSMKDVLIDSNATDHLLNDAEWIAFRVVRRLVDVKADKSLKNTRELDANYSPSKPEEPKVGSPNDGDDRAQSDEKWLEYWVRWDKRRKLVVTYVDDGENALAEGPWPIGYDRFPLEVLYWNECPDDLFAISDVDLMIHQQDYLNRLESLQLDHVRRISSAKYLVTEKAIDENEMLKLASGPSGTIALVKTSPPSAAIEPLRDNAVSQDQYILSSQVKNNIRETLGIAAYESGVSQKFDTAAEPELIQQGINIKRDDRKDMMADMWKRVMRKLLVILQETLEKTEIPLSEGQFNTAKVNAPSKLSRIIGVDGSVVLLPFLNVSGEDIQGEYEFNIDMGSDRPDNEATRRAELAMTFQGIPQQLWAHIDTPKALKHILTTGLGPVLAAELQRDPRIVMQEQQAAAQAQFQQMMQLEQMKHVLPAQTKEKVAAMHHQTAVATASIQADAQKSVQAHADKSRQEDTIFKAVVDSNKETKKSEKEGQ